MWAEGTPSCNLAPYCLLAATVTILGPETARILSIAAGTTPAEGAACLPSRPRSARRGCSVRGRLSDGRGRGGVTGRGPEARRDRRECGKELLGHLLPGEGLGEAAGAVAGNGERGNGRLLQVVVKDTRVGAADDIDRAGDRIGRNGQAARQRLEHHEAEGVGPARKHEQVGGGIVAGEFLATLRSREDRLGIGRLEPGAIRAVADDDLGTREIEAEEILHRLLRRDPADIEGYRAGQA